ncbi:MAG TPA: DUF4388 domain-containing protein, partial [Candidatus Eisenbacteria bacterium]|nr:DUF4388 domain-containing protein [Candidatus Eisenbacteria bacterium]
MAIQSSISELGLFELFQILHMNAKTGRLIVSDTPDGREAQVLFHDGAVSFAQVYDRAARPVPALLVEWGVLDDESLRRMEATLPRYADLLACLDGEGIVPRSHMENFLGNRVRECVYELFKWDRGECRFIDEELDARTEVLVALNTENLILEGARRIDEWTNIKNKVPSRHSVFRFCADKEKDQALNLKPLEWEILSLIDGNRSVDEVNGAVGEDLFSTSKLIYGLVVMGVIELRDADDDGAADGSEQRTQSLIERGRELYGRLNLERAAAEFEKAVQLDPECFEAIRMLGEIYYKMDRLSEALMYLAKARSMDPANQKAMFIKGYLHARLGEVEQAIGEWEELRDKASSRRIADLVTHRIAAAKEWEKVLQ